MKMDIYMEKYTQRGIYIERIYILERDIYKDKYIYGRRWFIYKRDIYMKRYIYIKGI